MSEKVEMNGEYWDSRYVNGGINLACPHVWKHIIKYFVPGNENVLDIGCGVGLGLRLINLLHPEKKLYGVDVSELAVERVKKSLPSVFSQNITCSKVPPLNYEDDFFNVIVCTEFIEHVKDTLFVLKEIKRVLKKEGRVLLTIPDDCLGTAKEHMHQWNFDGFNELCESVGFTCSCHRSFYVDKNADYLFMELRIKNG